jgi:hypothetical protein
MTNRSTQSEDARAQVESAVLQTKHLATPRGTNTFLVQPSSGQRQYRYVGLELPQFTGRFAVLDGCRVLQ